MLCDYWLATLSIYYSSSFDAVNKVCSNEIYPWELKRSSVPDNYLDSKINRTIAITWLIRDKLKLLHE